MNIEYLYYRKRALFGCPFSFSSEGPTVVLSNLPDKELADKYILKNPVHKSTQESAVRSLHEANTWRSDFTDRGINHDQGGWPKDLNILDEEAVLRFRKKLEREENYVASLKTLTKPIEHAILQNNAINIYEKYFESATKQFTVTESLSQIRNIYRDVKKEETKSISHLSWGPEKGIFAASYGQLTYQPKVTRGYYSAFLWNVEISNAPQITCGAEVPILSLEWHPTDHNMMTAGMQNGQIAFYDVRKAPDYVDITTDLVSHRDPVHSVLWINSKTGVDFFSTSADGVVKWWDCRNLSQVTDSIILDPSKTQSMVNAYAASCLEYDSTIPAKYLVGTETGNVICGNRKGATISEKLPWVLKAHMGPIYSLMRNPTYAKIFLTVGDWNVRIWSEECRESPVMWIKNYAVALTSAEWSKGRYSVFCTTRSDGVLDVWDLLFNQISPHVSVRVTDKGLTTLRLDDQGQFVVVGDECGNCHLVQFGESLTRCEKNDKNLLTAMFERETRREKILESRMREIRLNIKLKAQTAEEGDASKADITDKVTKLAKVEEDYWDEVQKMKEAFIGSSEKQVEEGKTSEEEEEVEVEDDKKKIKREVVVKEEPQQEQT